uniref:Ig-like domain-containing protein n=1 Tax=Periophthalmus magnuspinnatus TaxID=409849 RepID=A0A3B4BEH2_9GOBI
PCSTPFILSVSDVSLSLSDQHRAPKTFHVSEGQLFILPCSPAGQQRNVSWSREGQKLDQEGQRLIGSLGVEVQEGRLWFKPVQSRHSGVYTCHYRSQTGEHQAQMELSVSREKCPFADEHRTQHQGVTGMLPCKLQHHYKFYNLSSTRPVRWMKDCAPLHRAGAPVRVDEWGYLWLQEASSQDTGTYTCFLDLSVEGQNYSAAWSMEVTILTENCKILSSCFTCCPVGDSVELQCRADLGYSKDDHTFMYWLLNHTHTDDHPGVQEGWRVHGVSTLLISQVHPGLLNVSIMCCVNNPVGEDHGQLWLTQADTSAFHRSLGWSLGLSLALLLLVASVYYCRVELLLLHRDLRGRCSKHYVADEKLYDGIVTCLHPSGLVPSELDPFCLQLLPQRLETQWGYKLYIPGRDNCPGEGDWYTHYNTIYNSLIFTGFGVDQYGQQVSPPSKEYTSYIGGPVDYSRLPKSVQYLKRTQGALLWRPAPRGRLGFLRSERSFWNRLHYYMPQVPSGKSQLGPKAFSPASSVVVC